MEGSGEARREGDGPPAPNRQDNNLPGGDVLTVEHLQELVFTFTGKLSDVFGSLNRQDNKNKQTKIESLWKELHQLQKKFKDNINQAIATDAYRRETIITLEEQLFRKLPNMLKKMSCYEGSHSRSKEAIKTLQRQERAQEAVNARRDAQMEKNERLIAALQQASFDGTLGWKIQNLSSKRRDGTVVDSPLIFTGQAGYKMGLRMYLNGVGTGKDTHVSLQLLMMRGKFDAILDWDSNFRQKITVEIVAKRAGDNVVKVLPVPSSGFKRPPFDVDMYVASECPLFLPLTDLDDRDRGFVHDDEMTIRVVLCSVLRLLDQNEKVTDAFRPDPTSSSFQRPTSDMNIASGCPLFVPLSQLDSSSHGCVREDTLFVKVVVDTSDLL
ncbi:TRAF1 [Branchiostoma lanceolatum]|uniref:TRAF1 protein n=1 Tax=Branchiostoma lanceolatum TaxID=7740 RepID=A0A8K0A9K2_BRALA|nr:TRAF1 [Branchiostoma lanceolatum]